MILKVKFSVGGMQIAKSYSAGDFYLLLKSGMVVSGVAREGTKPVPFFVALLVLRLCRPVIHENVLLAFSFW